MAPIAEAAIDPIAAVARHGLTSSPKSLPPWLFYDEAGSHLFEQITALPEYYLTRTERDLFAAHADEVVQALGAPITVSELGAGTASKTGILLEAAMRAQGSVLYQPIDISPTALAEAREQLEAHLSGVTVRPETANYVTDPIRIARLPGHKVLALYIGSSIGNFSPREARSILRNLRAELQPGDALLLGADLAPTPTKPVDLLLAAYDDAQGVTAAFNRNILHRLNRDLGSDFDAAAFRHLARWNAVESRIEMHLQALSAHSAHIPATSSEPALRIDFRAGETIHTENSYKFTPESITLLLRECGFSTALNLSDQRALYAVNLSLATI